MTEAWNVSRVLGSVAILLAGGVIATLGAHGRDARYIEDIGWKKPHFARVFAASRSELGLSGSKVRVKTQTVDGKACVVGSLIAFDVDDQYAFDIDEPVTLTVTYAPSLSTAAFAVAWDRNGGEGYGVSPDTTPEPGAPLRRIEITLDRARLAGQSVAQADLAVAARTGGVVGLCDIELARSRTAKAVTAAGGLRLEVEDAATHRLVPARVGLYDATGRIPLPSSDSVLVHRFADEARLLWMNRRTPWPSANRQAFYVSGSYSAQVPAGSYDLVITRGPEYKTFNQRVEIEVGSTRTVRAQLQRYSDSAAGGWFSGESHVHLLREQAADVNILNVMEAEDLHLANLLEMGNINGTYFKQSIWDRVGRFARDGYVLVSGQEDPRTGMRGHTIHWNVKQPAHFDPQVFFNYHWVFEQTRRQGALTGYAHLGESFNGKRGLAIDVPFGLVDFIEVLQGGRLNTEVWYSFLNLGYKVLPVGGADFPYFGPTLPGIERTYAKVAGEFSADGWFDGVRRGTVYVSNGPLLQLTVNGHQVGEEIHVARGAHLDIAAAAQLNPDIDPLDRLELVVLGDVAATERGAGGDRLILTQDLVADHSMWIAARAYGGHQEPQFTTVAHTAPVYVVVDDEPTWKREAVPGLVAYQRAQLQELITVPIDPNSDLEAWETGDILVDQWPRQLPQLKPRIEEADRKYQDILTRLSNRGGTNGTRGSQR